MGQLSHNTHGHLPGALPCFSKNPLFPCLEHALPDPSLHQRARQVALTFDGGGSLERCVRRWGWVCWEEVWEGRGAEVDGGSMEGTEEREDWLKSRWGMAGSWPSGCGWEAGMLERFCRADDDPICRQAHSYKSNSKPVLLKKIIFKHTFASDKVCQSS